ncbi:carboxymuconolactone decarboxylase family protein [Xanthomonas sp. A2111]|uniref:Carboxymuconolactone decarboxylase family protein n=1 Tax=Xanthomonas hawaiiensis TaxID=3003247 RepID=A0ABU2I636_9XANT|nr:MULTISPECIES: carboxymuconolactone decarboxylase family protein [unclassified Xanthomonas]MBO9830532.1 carboxymuconolactone decarboxylase family protein [Xanthomonas sp. A2111]MBO9875792.1 carboxymuconolactone decarboxylase family protein [Xanthomonas sp. D-93]MDS9993589.1 carboxymuconolactone decarboxylase family protein [Xanthomonas sp. A2111]WNH45336.1 carboxymuconolactone decarboxylase family protein [Xanthomonas sp. A6251]
MSDPATPFPSAQAAFGDIAPAFVRLTDEVLFAEVWQRPGLSPRERSLITVAALVALCRPEQLPFHLARALDNGLDRDALAEAITHLAFYAGWPCAASALPLLRAAGAAKSTTTEAR